MTTDDDRPDGPETQQGEIQRACAACGKALEITVHEDGTYEGGHYFGEELLDGDEYWECDECYHSEDLSGSGKLDGSDTDG